MRTVVVTSSSKPRRRGALPNCLSDDVRHLPAPFEITSSEEGLFRIDILVKLSWKEVVLTVYTVRL